MRKTSKKVMLIYKNLYLRTNIKIAKMICLMIKKLIKIDETKNS